MDTLNGPSKPVCFRLPNGQWLHQCFYENVTMRVNKSVSIFYDIFVIFQELYEYILSTGQIEGACFTLFQSFPRCKLFPTETRWEGNSEVIPVEINDNSPDLLINKLFKDSMVSLICRQVLLQRL